MTTRRTMRPTRQTRQTTHPSRSWTPNPQISQIQRHCPCRSSGCFGTTDKFAFLASTIHTDMPCGKCARCTRSKSGGVRGRHQGPRGRWRRLPTCEKKMSCEKNFKKRARELRQETQAPPPATQSLNTRHYGAFHQRSHRLGVLRDVHDHRIQPKGRGHPDERGRRVQH